MSVVRRPGWILATAPGARVTRLELFYDLVFVFAFLNVTTLLAKHLSALTLLAGTLVLALLWWCWVTFAALGNVVRADHGVVPLIGAATIAALVVLAVSVPVAFVDRPGGLPGPLVFASCYLLIRGLQTMVLVLLSPSRGRALLHLGLPLLVSVALILIATALPVPVTQEPTVTWSRLGLWTVAVLIEFTSGAWAQRTGLVVISAAHWAERHALIVLIALGESIISLGLGPNLAAGLPITWPTVVASVLGIIIISALWWMYFDALAPALEQRLHRTRDAAERMRYARWIYAYLHFPVIAGVILFALGLKRYLTDIADPTGDPWSLPGGPDHRLLFGGVILYIAALSAMALRSSGRIDIAPAVTLVVLIAGTPVAGRSPALVGLGLLALVCVALVLVGLRSPDPRRHRVREIALAEQLATEHAQSEWRRRNL